MQFTIQKSTLQGALQQLGKVVPSRSTLPILSSVLLSAKDGRLSLRATDLEISQIITVDATIGAEGEVAVPQRTFLEITSEMPDGELTFEVQDNNQVKLTAAFGTYSIMGKPAAEYPSLPTVDRQQPVEIGAALLRRVIDKTAFAVSRDDLKPSLMGVLFRFREDNFIAVATDSHRLVRYTYHEPPSGGYVGDNIIPVKFLHILTGYLDNVETVTFNIGENHIMVQSGDTELFTRIIEERFPDYETVFPKENNKKLVVEREEFLAAVRRVSIFSNRTTHQISLKLGADGLNLSTEDAETVSAAQEQVKGVFEGEELMIGYNANYLRDVISHLDSDTVNAEFNSAVSAAIFYSDQQREGEDLTMLLMPIRLSE